MGLLCTLSGCRFQSAFLSLLRAWKLGKMSLFYPEPVGIPPSSRPTRDSFLSLTVEPWLSPSGHSLCLPFPEESWRWMIRSPSPWQPERSFCTPTEGLESVPSSGGRDRKESSSDISHTSVGKLPHVFGQVTSCPCADLVLR